MSPVNRSPSKDAPSLPRTRWVTEGFESFRRGTFGNGGHNLFVSRGGVLQRIHQYDLNRSGYVDLLFCNSQNHWEAPPSYVYQWTGERFVRREIDCRSGTNCGTLADLNGDGRPELIIGHRYDGVTFDLNAGIYFGSDRGWGEHAVQYLPVGRVSSVAAGDFDGDGKKELVFQRPSNLRVYKPTPLGIEPISYSDLPIVGFRLAAGDLDGDGFDDLFVLHGDGSMRVYWGGRDGLELERWTQVPMTAAASSVGAVAVSEGSDSVEWVEPVRPLPVIAVLNGHPHVFVAYDDSFELLRVEPDRSFVVACAVPCARAVSITIADLDADGFEDLAVACSPVDGGPSGWLYWGGSDGFRPGRRTALPSRNASDIATGDFDGDGRLEVALCQPGNLDLFTSSTVVFRIQGREATLWQELESHDARRILSVRESSGGPDPLIVLNLMARSKRGDIDVSIYQGGADGFSAQRRVQLPGFGATVAVCADLTDNGWPDVVVMNTSENAMDEDPGSYIYLNGPEGLSRSPKLIPTHLPHGMACADLDRDGYLDLLFAGIFSDELQIFHGSADGFTADRVQRIKLVVDGVVHRQVRYIYLADLNNNGWLDIVLPFIDSDYSLVLFGGPEGFSIERSQKLSVRHACCARAADLDGDGYLDLIVGGHIASEQGPHDSWVYIYWNGPDGLREDARTLLPANAVNSMSVADFNNDGNLDLFVGNYHDGRKNRDIDSYIYWNRGGRGFTAGDRQALRTHSASGDFAADFNEDGWIDLAVANHKIDGDHVGHATVWWNGPDGFHERNTTSLPTSGPHGMMVPGPGNLMNRCDEEYYVSEPFQVPASRHPSRISWAAQLLPKTWVRAQMRSADSIEQLQSAPWLGTNGPGSWFENGDDLSGMGAGTKWIQYQLALGARNSGSTPRVTSVIVEFD